jgi:hypothetical protein
MEGLTRSSSRPGAVGNPRALASVLVGAASVLSVPAGFLVADRTSVTIVQSGVSAAPGILLGIVAIVLARRGRERFELTIGRAGGRLAARIGRWLGIVGICVAITAALALAFFGVLTWLAD